MMKLKESIENIEEVVYDNMYSAIQELGDATVNEYIQFFVDISAEAFIRFTKEELEELTKYVTEYYNTNVIQGNINTGIVMTEELKNFIEGNSYLLDSNINLLIDKAPKNIKDELLYILKQLEIEY